MTQRNFSLLFIIGFTALYFGLTCFFSEAKLSGFIVIWVLAGYYIGQYSARFPKN